MNAGREEIERYVDVKRELHNLLLQFIENSSDEESNYTKLTDFIETRNYNENHEELKHFLHLIISLFNNYHRNFNFSKKIEKILHFTVPCIKQAFSNIEILYFFKESKPILLYFFENNIIELDESILNKIIQINDENENRYCHFFYPQIKPFITEKQAKEIEIELFEYNQNALNNFEEKQKSGENESYICTLIRNDSIDDFISHINQFNISLLSEIRPSIFETNTFLFGKNPTLLEYSAFFGSIRIFKYLLLNKVNFSPSLWLYAIHSNNAEIISIIEENQVKPNDLSFSECLSEAIKCHHNEIANYIYLNFFLPVNKNKSKRTKLTEEVVESIFSSDNYKYFPYNFDDNISFFYLCKYKYDRLVNFFLNEKEDRIKKQIILKTIKLIQIKFKKKNLIVLIIDCFYQVFL